MLRCSITLFDALCGWLLTAIGVRGCIETATEQWSCDVPSSILTDLRCTFTECTIPFIALKHSLTVTARRTTTDLTKRSDDQVRKSECVMDGWHHYSHMLLANEEHSNFISFERSYNSAISACLLAICSSWLRINRVCTHEANENFTQGLRIIESKNRSVLPAGFDHSLSFLSCC